MEVMQGITIAFDAETREALARWEKAEKQKRTVLIRDATRRRLKALGFLKKEGK